MSTPAILSNDFKNSCAILETSVCKRLSGIFRQEVNKDWGSIFINVPCSEVLDHSVNTMDDPIDECYEPGKNPLAYVQCELKHYPVEKFSLLRTNELIQRRARIFLTCRCIQLRRKEEHRTVTYKATLEEN